MASFQDKAFDNKIHVASLNEKYDADVQPQDDGSSIVEGSEGVTHHELATLRHVADRLPYTAWLVVVVELAERLVPLPPTTEPALNPQ